MIKRVFIASPFAGNVERNLKYLDLCIKDAIEKGEAPFAPHYIYPKFLNDEIPEQREHGIILGLRWLFSCDTLLIYNNFGISKGMQQEIRFAAEHNIPIEFRVIRASIMDKLGLEEDR